MADSQDPVDDADWLRHAVASGAIQVAKLEAEIERLRLTDAERRWIQWAIEVSESLEECGGAGLEPGVSAMPTMVLRGLLERTK
jgi:hypothetical protein